MQFLEKICRSKRHFGIRIAVFFAFLAQLFLVLEHYDLKRRRLLLREASLFACWMGIRNPKNKLIRSPFHLLKAARKENTFGPIRYNPPRKLLIYTELEEEAIYKVGTYTYISREMDFLYKCVSGWKIHKRYVPYTCVDLSKYIFLKY